MIKLKSLLTERSNSPWSSIQSYDVDSTSMKKAQEPNPMYKGHSTIDLLMFDWMFTDTTRSMPKKFKFVEANISKLIAPMKKWEHFNRGSGFSIADSILYNIPRNGGVYEVYFDIIAKAIKNAGQGTITYDKIKGKSGSKKMHSKGSEESIAMFGI